MALRVSRSITWALAAALASASPSIARQPAFLQASQDSGPPTVRGITFRSYPEIGGIYERGETVEVAVDFTAYVKVSGTPQLALIVGDEIRWAAFSHNIRWTNFLSFRYTVQAADRDANGISVPADAIRLNGGSIRAGPEDVVDAVLRHQGVGDSGTHRVDGGRFTAPTVRDIAFESSPLHGDTYEFGEQVRLVVDFSRSVVASTGVRLALVVGDQTRLADLSTWVDSAGSSTLNFSYQVGRDDRDTDGISVPANAIRLGGGGVIAAAVDRDVDAVVTHDGIPPDSSRKVDGGRYTAPKITSISFSGYPSLADTYELGEHIGLRLEFDKAVTVEGGPRVALDIGGRRRQALFYPSDSFGVHFRYAVQATDRDVDGISVVANSLTLNGGRIRAASDGAGDADLRHGAIASDGRRRVDGSRVSVPTVRGVSFRNHGPHERGETLSVGVEFTRPVTVTGRPQLALVIGSEIRLATYSPGCARSRALYFDYRVQAADRDDDGVSLRANAIRLSGGTIRSATDGVTDANLIHAPMASEPGLVVDGSRATAPRVSLMRFRGPASSYELGDTVEVEVEFDPSVTVTGNPVVELDVGGQTRLASYTHGLIFQYTVQASDRDNDGISIPANALRANSGTIAKRSDAGATGALLEHEAVPADPARRVDGSRVPVPRVSRVLVGSGTSGLGDVVQAVVDFTRHVKVTGSPQLALTIGGRTRLAAYAGGDSTYTNSRIYFRYTVRADDREEEGVSIPANAIRLNGGTIKAVADRSTDAELSHQALDSEKRVDGSRTEPLTASIFFGESPRGCGTYERGETIWVGARLREGNARDVIVSGRPKLALHIGDRVRLATYSVTGSRRGPPYWPRPVEAPSTLWFGYTVQAGDRDPDGISVPANAIRFDGGTIRLAGDSVPRQPPPSYALNPDLGRRVDGRLAAPPTLDSVSLRGSPEVADTYGLGETIVVAARFSRAVAVTGNPQVALTIGDRTRAATFSPGPLPSTRTLLFQYAVQPGDLDTDGVSVAADSLNPAGGAIKLPDGVTDADLSHSGLADDAVHKVDASQVVPPTVDAVRLRGFPAEGDTYRAGEPIEVEVKFSKAVTVTGDPRLVLIIGGVSRMARHSPGPQPSLTQSFRYTVQPVDRDEDGVGVPADGLRVNGGAIRLVDGVTDAVLGHAAVSDDPSRKVWGLDGGPSVPTDSCEPDAERACLQDSRFEVRTMWWQRDGPSGPARVAAAGTDDSGLFWFFDPDNWEILVKVLDGCSANGHFWVFGAATTDLGYRITVTDTATGRVRVYRHELGEPAAAITDSTAFADGCRR